MKTNKKIITGKNKFCNYEFEIGFTYFENQAPYFSITGQTWELGKPRSDKYMISCGALSLKDYIPELAYLDKYHLMSFEGPMHYIANSLYFASNKDYNNLLKGEKKQIINQETGLPYWSLVAIDKNTGEEIDLYKIDKQVESKDKPSCQYFLDFRPWCKIGEGKEPDLEAARASAIWPEASLDDFTEEKLLKRLPDLIKQFKADLLKAGIELPQESED